MNIDYFFTDFTEIRTFRALSPHTIASYRDTFRLILRFAEVKLKKAHRSLFWTISIPNSSARSWMTLSKTGATPPRVATSA
jgi:hypothetical protein